MRVFITGASSGIGAAMAKKFDAMGAQLGLVGRSQEKLDAVLSSMQNAQAHTTYALDVTDRAALFAAARDFDGKAPVDIVLANAGISIGVKTEYEEDLDVLEKVYRTNVFAMAATFHRTDEQARRRPVCRHRFRRRHPRSSRQRSLLLQQGRRDQLSGKFAQRRA